MDITRRRFLALGGAAGVLGIGATIGRRAAAEFGATATPILRADPFTLGVASGDPWPDSIVLWTRLLPNPDDLHPFGTSDRVHEVAWQVATDERMTSIEREGTTWARPETAHAVHSVVSGLRPGREYWYRFRVGPWMSPIGRTKTTPAAGERPGPLDIVAASCQNWAAGYYTAHRHLAAERPDVVVFLGDYIYEYGIGGEDGGRGNDIVVPDHLASETDTLERYRAQYAWYKRDPDLQAAHHAAPWVATWDDHEVEDNYAGDIAASTMSRAAFAARRAAAYQAYWEHLPLRQPRPLGPAMTMHRRIRVGSLATLHMLDTRQHRSDQIPGDAWQHDSVARANRARTMLGDRQQRWLHTGLVSSTTTWNVIVQQVIAGRLDVDTDGDVHNVDTWDGYPAAQQLLHDALATTANPIVLTGDLHAGYALDIRAPLGAHRPATIATEFAATSISSGGDGHDLSSAGQRLLAANPHLHYANQRRGYLRCRLTADHAKVDFRTVPYVTGAADAPITTDRSFVVEAGTPGIQDY